MPSTRLLQTASHPLSLKNSQPNLTPRHPRSPVVSQASQQVGGTGVAAPPPAAAGAMTAAPSAAPDATVSTPPGSAAPSPAAKAAGASTISTPQRLRLLSLGVVVVGLVIGVVGALIFTYLAVSLSRAKADTAQLIRVQKIQST